MTKRYDPDEPKTTADALMAKQTAKRIRQKVKSLPDYNPHFDKVDLERADRMDAKADALLALPVAERGMGGELVPPPDYNKMGLTLTHKAPDKVNLEASISRATLADDNGVLIEALDAAESMQAQDAAEQMLCHQMPTLHRAGMELLQRAGNCSDTDRACKLVNTAARLFDTYQRSMVALKTYRRGGTQVIKHIHQNVQVQDGGQAIVTGAVGDEDGGKQ